MSSQSALRGGAAHEEEEEQQQQYATANDDDVGDAPALSSWTKVRQTIFPIYGPEAKKFLLIGSIKFFIILALTLTRDTKDTLIVTQCGAEAIAFLKVRTRDKHETENQFTCWSRCILNYC
jgi:hypothetical protein